MKITGLLLSVVVLFLLGGCASIPNNTEPMAQDNVDYQKVYLVEQWAKRNNADVRWLNYPLKKVATATTQ
jgi:hypothetical protein